MRTVVDQALLVLAAAALGGAAWRVAGRATEETLERLVAAVPLAVAAAVIEALLLGRVGLSGSPFALAAFAVATWLGAQRIPAERGPRRRAGLEAGLAAPALLGALAGAAVWAERRPLLGFDGLGYHLGEAVVWVQRGSAGSVEPLIAGIPVGNYPVTAETALSWLLGLSHSFAPVAAWSALLLLVFVAGAWLGLRTLEVPPALAGLAIAAFCSTPLVLRQIVQVETDFPALAWLAATAGLSAAAVRRPALLAPALVAAGLAVGTKTTTLPLAAIALGAAAFALRGRLRPLRGALALAAGAAVAAGGLWYLRNLVQHGSPLWPLAAAPWGDPVPGGLGRLDTRFLERPGDTLAGPAGDYYRNQLAGMLPVFAAGVLAPLWARDRATLAAAGAALLAGLLWCVAPFTGNSGVPGFEALPLNTLRYASPALAAGAAALALAGRHGPRAALASAIVFALAIGWNAYRYLADPYLAGEALLLAAVVAGAGAALAARPLLRSPRLALAAAALGAVAFLALTGPGWTARHAEAGELDAGLLKRFHDDPAWRDGDAPVARTPSVFATLAGDRLRHDLSLVAPREPCAQVLARARRGWVATGAPERGITPALSAPRCLRGLRPAFVVGDQRVYGGGG